MLLSDALQRASCYCFLGHTEVTGSIIIIIIISIIIIIIISFSLNNLRLLATLILATVLQTLVI